MKQFAFAGLVLVMLVVPAAAEENFIPLGTGFSTEIDSVAVLNSKRDKIAAQSDIIETDIYRRALEAQQQDSRFRRFFSDTESHGVDYSVDY